MTQMNWFLKYFDPFAKTATAIADFARELELARLSKDMRIAEMMSEIVERMKMVQIEEKEIEIVTRELKEKI